MIRINAKLVIFIMGCFIDFINYTGGHNCPTCQVEMNEEDLSANLFVKTIIEDMLVTCPCLEDSEVKVLGCNWTGTYLERCSRVCPMLFGDCPNEGCDVKSLRLPNLKTHKAKCLRRPTFCVACAATVPFDEFPRHNLNGQCPFRLVDCECGDEVRMCDMESHVRDTCDHAQIPCPILQELKVCSVYCTGTITRKNLYCDAHLGFCSALVKTLFTQHLLLKTVEQVVIVKAEGSQIVNAF